MIEPVTIPESAPLCAGPDTNPRPSSLSIPPGACDSHAHICGPMIVHPYVETRIYTPPDALLPQYRTVLSTLGITRAVLVQPSVYGDNNRVLVEALQEGAGAYRGVAVVEPSIGDDELTALDRAGVRGIRINVVDVKQDKNVVPIELMHEFARRIIPFGWHIEFLLQIDAIADLETVFAGLPVDIVLGHFGYLHVERGDESHPSFRALLRLIKTGRCWVKLTGPYRISAKDQPYDDMGPFARALIENAADRLVWGTDWPHVMVKKCMPNDGTLLDLLGDWTGWDSSLLRRILSANPASLYGFQD